MLELVAEVIKANDVELSLDINHGHSGGGREAFERRAWLERL